MSGLSNRHAPFPFDRPEDADRDVYIVLEDFGRLSRAWRETDADRGTLMRLLLEGSFG